MKTHGFLFNRQFGFPYLALQMSCTVVLAGGAMLHHQLGQERHRRSYNNLTNFLLFTPRKIVKTYGFNTLSLQMSWTLFLWTIRIMPGGWSHASPSTWTGTPSSPRIRMTIDLHWAIRCLCRLTILEAPMCMEPNTATTLNYT